MQIWFVFGLCVVCFVRMYFPQSLLCVMCFLQYISTTHEQHLSAWCVHDCAVCAWCVFDGWLVYALRMNLRKLSSVLLRVFGYVCGQKVVEIRNQRMLPLYWCQTCVCVAWGDNAIIVFSCCEDFFKCLKNLWRLSKSQIQSNSTLNTELNWTHMTKRTLSRRSARWAAWSHQIMIAMVKPWCAWAFSFWFFSGRCVCL